MHTKEVREPLDERLALGDNRPKIARRLDKSRQWVRLCWPRAG